MTREESLQLLHSVYEDIKNMTQEDIDDFNNTINEYKKEQKVNKEEAIERLKNIKSVPSMFIDEIIKELVEAFQQPPTLLEILGWEDRQEYKWRGDIFRVQSDILQVWDREDEMWFDSSKELNDYLRLRQAKKVEPKIKAWYVRDEYSLDCLIEELKEQGVTHSIHSTKEEMKRDFKVGWKIIFVDTDNTFNSFHTDKLLDNKYDIIDYHKVEPRYLLQTDLTSENGIQYLSFDKNRRKYFIGALIASDNVQQKFTDDEITKINLITRFAKPCKKIEVE